MTLSSVLKPNNTISQTTETQLTYNIVTDRLRHSDNAIKPKLNNPLLTFRVRTVVEFLLES